jgi:aminomethyltransferase
LKDKGAKRKRVGIIMVDKGIPRPGFPILNKREQQVGRLTSGTFSPLLKCGIGMGYVEVSEAQEGNLVSIEIRGKQARARIASFPLFSSDEYGYRRKIVS